MSSVECRRSKEKSNDNIEQQRITMLSPHHSPSSPSTSDVNSSLCTTKSKQNGEISANEKDNRSSQKHNDVASRKRDEPEDEDESERKNEHSNTNNKKVRVSVSVASLPEPEPEPESELKHALEPPASFDSLDDDCLGNVLDFVGKKCYSAFGRVNKRCHEMFCSKGLPKETYRYGYAPLQIILQRRGKWYFSKGCINGVLHYNRRDIFEWILLDESIDGYSRLNWLCDDAIKESRLDILCEVFQRANNGRQLEYLRDFRKYFDLCYRAAECGKLECLKFLRENECDLSKSTWFWAKDEGQEHILEYLRNHGYPIKWQN